MKKLVTLLTSLMYFCSPLRAVIFQKTPGKESLTSVVAKYAEECGDRFSCRSRDASIFVGNAKNIATPGLIACQCDIKCVKYGDCCVDADVEEETSYRISQPWTCLPLSVNEGNHEVVSMYMIGECATDANQTLSSKCDRRNSHDYTYLMDVPVFSTKTRRTYSNVFCAQCNSDVEHLIPWSLTIKCNQEISFEELFIRDDFKYIPKKRRWVHSITGESCELVVNELSEATDFIKSVNGRSCVSTTDDCSPNWKYQHDKYKCKSYVFYVESKNGELFKNPHCARCNGVADADIRCYATVGSSYRSTIVSSLVPYKYSLSFPLDFTSSANKFQDVAINNHYPNRRESAKTRVAKRIFQNSSCPKRQISQGVDFKWHTNGSVYLKCSGRTLDPHQYFLSKDNSTVQICDVTRDFFRGSAEKRTVSDVCLIISIACLGIHIAISAVLPSTRNVQGINLLSLSCSLFFGHLLFLTGKEARQTIGYELCAAVGALIHWFYLAAFFWMNVMGFEISKTFSSTSAMIEHHNASMGTRRSTLIMYSAYAWISPTVIVALGLLFDFTDLADAYAPNYGCTFCWFDNRAGRTVFFVLPMGLLLLANCAFFFFTARTIFRHRSSSDLSSLQHFSSGQQADSTRNAGISQAIQRNAKRMIKLQHRFMLYVKLALLTGLGWAFAFIASVTNQPDLWYPFTLLNALQGILIFFTVSCKRKTFETLKQRVHSASVRLMSKLRALFVC